MKKTSFAILTLVLIFFAVSVIADLYYYNKVKLPKEDGPWQIAYSDFRVYWTTAKVFYLRYINDPAYGPVDKRYGPIYDFKKEFYHFRYSPFIAFAFVPLAQLPMGLALLVWSLLLNIFYAAAIIMLVNHFSYAGGSDKRKKIAISIMASALTIVLYLNNIALGQSDILVALFLCIFLFCYSRGRYMVAGIVFSLVLQMKPFFLPALLYFLLSGRIRLVFYTAIASIIFLAVPMIRPGYASEIFYINSEWMRMISGSVQSQLANNKNQSSVYMFLNMIWPGGAQAYAYKLSGAVYAAFMSALLWIRYRSMDDKDPDLRSFEVSYLILASLLSSPLVWKASFICSLIPLTYILFLFAGRICDIRLRVFLAAYFILTSMVSSGLMRKAPIAWAAAFQPLAAGTIVLFIFLTISRHRQYRRA